MHQIPAGQLFNLNTIAVMQQSLDLSAVSLLGRDEGTCKVSAQCSAELITSVSSLAVLSCRAFAHAKFWALHRFRCSWQVSAVHL